MEGELLKVATLENGRLLYNSSCLENILNNVQKPEFAKAKFGVMGIVGKAKGKSTILDFILRASCDFEDEKWQNFELIDKSFEGFLSATEDSRVEGVFIWSNPVVINTDKGCYVVFLLDTCQDIDEDGTIFENIIMTFCTTGIFFMNEVTLSICMHIHYASISNYNTSKAKSCL